MRLWDFVTSLVIPEILQKNYVENNHVIKKGGEKMLNNCFNFRNLKKAHKIDAVFPKILRFSTGGEELVL